MLDASQLGAAVAATPSVTPEPQGGRDAAHISEAVESHDAPIGLAAVVRALRRGGAAEQVRAAWHYLRGKPGGRKLFSRLIGALAPYSGSIGAEVLELEHGRARVLMRDRRRLRNHLRSLHALALGNLAEYTGNLALAYAMPSDARFIVTRLQMEYLRKARGSIIAECRGEMPTSAASRELELVVELRDADSALVARGTLYSLVGPVTSPKVVEQRPLPQV